MAGVITMGPKTTIYSIVAALLLGSFGAVAYFRHRASVEHDAAVQAQTEADINAASLKYYANSIAADEN